MKVVEARCYSLPLSRPLAFRFVLTDICLKTLPVVLYSAYHGAVFIHSASRLCHLLRLSKI